MGRVYQHLFLNQSLSSVIQLINSIGKCRIKKLLGLHESGMHKWLFPYEYIVLKNMMHMNISQLIMDIIFFRKYLK